MGALLGLLFCLVWLAGAFALAALGVIGVHVAGQYWREWTK